MVGSTGFFAAIILGETSILSYYFIICSVLRASAFECASPPAGQPDGAAQWTSMARAPGTRGRGCSGTLGDLQRPSRSTSAPRGGRASSVVAGGAAAGEVGSA